MNNTDASVGITVRDMTGLRSDFDQKLAGEHGQEWREAFKLFLKRANYWPEAVGLRDLPEKATSACFRGFRYFIRDDAINTSLPVIQPLSMPSQVNPYNSRKYDHLIDIMRDILNGPQLSEGWAQIGMIRSGHCLATTQLEALIDLTNAGTIRHHLVTDGGSNFFPVIGLEKATICIIGLSCHDRGPTPMDAVRQWNVRLHEFNSSLCLHSSDRFFYRTNCSQHL